MLCRIHVCDVVRNFAESNRNRPEVVRHLYADTTLIPTLVQEIDRLAFATNFFSMELAVRVSEPHPKHATPRNPFPYSPHLWFFLPLSSCHASPVTPSITRGKSRVAV